MNQHQALSNKHQAQHFWRPPWVRFLLTAYCLLLSASLLFSSGCVYRSVTIRTEPPGAFVYVNDDLKGQSPVTYDFLWYGWHRVMVRKEGFERVEDRKHVNAPFYLWIPFDFFLELVPFKVRDDRTWTYTLTPSTALPNPTPPTTAVIPAGPVGPTGAPAPAVETPPSTGTEGGAVESPPASEPTGETPPKTETPASPTTE